MSEFFFSIAPIFGTAILHLLWQGTLVGLFGAFALWLFRDSTPNTRHLISCGSLLLFPLSFTWTLTGLLNNSSSSGVGSAPSILTTTSPTQWIAYLWLGGILLMSFRFTREVLHHRRLRTQEISEPPPHWVALFNDLQQSLGLKRTVRLAQSGIALSPMVVGWISPIVLVPSYALTSLTPEQVRVILAHELAHIRRYDHWIALLQSFTEILFFFHPAVWWISKQIRIEREFCCDDLAVNAIGNRRELASALAHLEALRLPAIQAITAHGGSLKTRILRLVASQKNPQNTTHAMKPILSLPLAVLTLSVITLVACQTNQTTATPSSSAIPTSEIPKAPEWPKAKSSETSNRQVKIKSLFIEVDHDSTKATKDSAVRRLSQSEFETYLAELTETKGADLLTAPTVVTKEGQEAKLEIIREFAYPTNTSPNPEVAVVPVGVTNLLRPRATTDPNEVVVDLFAQVVEFEGFLADPDGNETPVFYSRTADASELVRSGETLLLSGLIKKEQTMIADKVPLLGDIPLLGKIFRSEETKEQERELIIAISPQYINPDGSIDAGE